MAKLGTIGAAAAAAFLLAGCAQQYEAEAPIVGWRCLPGYGYTCGGDYQANATVGLPFLWDSGAACYAGPNQWTHGSVEIQTGRLPPGLDFDYSTYNIVGVPTRAGSFSFRALFRGFYCEGGDNNDFSRDLTIVVTGN